MKKFGSLFLMKTAWLLISILHLNCGLVYPLDAQKTISPDHKNSDQAFLGVRIAQLFAHEKKSIFSKGKFLYVAIHSGETAMYDGFSQGVGVGLRNLGRGGIGILVDHNGNDTYRSGNFSQGTGYYFGAGLLFDFSGDDKYYCSRYGLGASAHSASGIFMDFSGDDAYHAMVQAACGSAWDLSSAFFCDTAGNDRYTSAPKEKCIMNLCSSTSP
ncbi:MAG: hypothetical protein R6U38_10395 [Desulfatiglandaceae bacterium]